jgi:uncharacterized protein YndB with AHSA1/START domain
MEKTMTGRTVEKVLQLDTPVERVWTAITDAGELSQWFGDEAEVDLRPGGDAAMTWENHGRYAMRIDEVEPPHRLVWSWVHEPDVPFEDAPFTTVEWILTERADGGTTLQLKESGFLTDKHQGENDRGWDEELGHLVALVGS